jgi:DNA-binding transcriptional LysR family regulator
MEIELARTFLEIIAAGGFTRAARRLNVSQTTVSARIRSLESQLGCPLFVRNRVGATLTPAGEQFLRSAPALLQVWEHARRQASAQTGHDLVLSLGGELSLWNTLLLKWLLRMRAASPEIALRTEIGLSDSLLRGLIEGTLDIAVMYAPRRLLGLQVEQLMEDELVLVTTEPGRRRASASKYVYVDWGPEFAAHHGMRFPDLTNPGLLVGLGPLGLNFILEAGGAGYFRRSSVRQYLQEGRLHLVSGAPAFPYAAYAVHSADCDAKLLVPALVQLRLAANEWGEAK